MLSDEKITRERKLPSINNGQKMKNGSFSKGKPVHLNAVSQSLPDLQQLKSG